jgi:peptide methionine sulfoxide reductase msrA/msrB
MVLKTKRLTPFQYQIIVQQQTEPAFSSDYSNCQLPGTYLCQQCGRALYRANAKFHSQCGWPSFDEEIPGAVGVRLDADLVRQEIICNFCKAHLGHVSCVLR